MGEGFSCRICGNSENNSSYLMKEGYFGTWEEFEYFKCGACGCLQIGAYPENMEKYYPEDYVSLKKREGRKLGFLKRILTESKSNAYLSGRGFIGKVLLSLGNVSKYLKWMKNAGCTLDSRILDVGCGSGKTLLQYYKLGFEKLTGADLFVKEDSQFENGVQIFKKEIFNVEGKFDFIILSHTLEHMPNQGDVFSKVHELLDDKGCFFIRIPICDCYLWREYKENWFSVEPPRHFYLHSLKSMAYMADKYSFDIKSIEYEGQPFSFYGSEQKKRGVSLKDENSYWINKDSDLFTAEEIENFNRKTKELNESSDGDFAIFYLFKKGK